MEACAMVTATGWDARCIDKHPGIFCTGMLIFLWHVSLVRFGVRRIDKKTQWRCSRLPVLPGTGAKIKPLVKCNFVFLLQKQKCMSHHRWSQFLARTSYRMMRNNWCQLTFSLWFCPRCVGHHSELITKKQSFDYRVIIWIYLIAKSSALFTTNEIFIIQIKKGLYNWNKYTRRFDTRLGVKVRESESSYLAIWYRGRWPRAFESEINKY